MAYLVRELASVPLDEHLIVLVSQGEEQALALLYDRYGRLVYTVALRITQDQTTAEEVVQDVFQAVWGSASSFQTGRSLRAWLVGIARYCAISATRVRSYQMHARALAIDDVLFVKSGEITDAITEAIVVGEALNKLPLEQRQVLEMVYYDGLTSRAVAAYIGEPLGTIKTRLRLGLLKMCTLLRSPET